MDNTANNAASPAVVNLAGALPHQSAELSIVFQGTSKPTGWVITIAGPGHPKTIAYNNEMERERLHRDALIEQSRANGKKYKSDELTPEESRRKFVEGLTARIVTWTPVDFGWGVVEFSEKTGVDTLLRPELGFAVGQIVDYLVGERAFMKDAAKT